MDLASVVAALASVGVRVSGSTPNNNIQGDPSRACPIGLAGPEPSGTHNDPGQHFHGSRGYLNVVPMVSLRMFDNLTSINFSLVSVRQTRRRYADGVCCRVQKKPNSGLIQADSG